MVEIQCVRFLSPEVKGRTFFLTKKKASKWAEKVKREYPNSIVSVYPEDYNEDSDEYSTAIENED